MTKLEPFLKWPGGKRLLTTKLMSLVPDDFGRYFEPFLGGGALFFALQPERAILADSNAELIECYDQVKTNCDDVVGQLRRLRNSKVDYYRIRAETPCEPAARAARLIYLVKLGFNGIYRVNRTTGQFNVPYGRRVELVVLNEDHLKAASRSLRNARVAVGDFEDSLKTARAGDLVYLDPPYTLAHTNNGFVRYNKRLFSWADQVRLARCADRLRQGGVRVIVSNAPHRSILELYRDFKAYRIRRPSQIAADKFYRRNVTELLLTANL